jgi:hypothetical protein
LGEADSLVAKPGGAGNSDPADRRAEPRAVFHVLVIVPANKGTDEAHRVCSTKRRGMVLNAILD